MQTIKTTVLIVCLFSCID